MKAKTTVVLFSVMVWCILPGAYPEATIYLDGIEEVHPGVRMQVSGAGFPGSSPYEILLDGLSLANGTTYAGGTFHRKLTLPRPTTIGSHNLTAVSGLESAYMDLVVTQWPVELSVVPRELKPGEEVTICGSGFPPRAYYEILPGVNDTLMGATDDYGNFCRTYRLPKDTPLGKANVVAEATKYGGPPSYSQEISVVQWQPEIDVSPTTVYPGAFIDITGSHFPPLASYDIMIDGEQIRIGTADQEGYFQRGYLVPSDIALGTHVLSAEADEYTGPPEALLDLEVTSWPCYLTIDPDPPHPGSNISISGSAFPSDAQFEVRLDGVKVASGDTTGQGTFTVYQPLASNLSLAEHMLLVTVTGYSGPPSGTLTFNVTQWPINVSIHPTDVHPDVRVNFSGSGFPPNASVRVLMDSTRILTVATDSTGGFEASYRLVKATRIGPHNLTFTVDGYIGPPVVSYELNVTQWPAQTEVLPSDLHPGGSLRMQGSDFPPGAVYFAYLGGVKIDGGVIDETGGFDLHEDLPTGLALGEQFLAIQTDFPGLELLNVSFFVTQWPAAIHIEPGNGSKDTPIEISGSGFPPDSALKILWDDIYIKAEEADPNGDYGTDVLARAGQAGYHILEVRGPEAYTGPPSISAYFWLGIDPPDTAAGFCDATGAPLGRVFPGDQFHVCGQGFPPSVNLSVHMLPAATPIDISNTVLSADGSIDAEGTFGFPIGALHEPGQYVAWIDLNQNRILDGNDIVTTTALQVDPRPDLGIVGAHLMVANPTQGQIVEVEVEVVNLGASTQSGRLILTYGGIDGGYRDTGDIDPGETVAVSIDWDTLSTPAGQSSLRIMLDPLPGEVALENNYQFLGPVKVRARPDISTQWVIPSAREVKRGKGLIVKAGVMNSGGSQESFRLIIRFGEREVCYREVTVDPGATRTFAFIWNTSGTSPATRTLSARAEALPFERDPSDNAITNGTVQVLQPNLAPRPDPHGPYEGTTGGPIEFDGSWSYDADGTIVSYRWAFGDGQTGTGVQVDHLYLEPGEYVVVLTVIDDDGDSGKRETRASIETALPQYQVSVWAVDRVRATVLSGFEIEIAGKVYRVQEPPCTLEIGAGNWSMMVTKAGYRPCERVVSVNRSGPVTLALAPLLDVFSSDSDGLNRDRYSVGHDVYATISSQGSYPVLVYVVDAGSATDQVGLNDVSTDGYEYQVTENGTSTLSIWKSPLAPGDYDIVLDLDSDGLFDRGLDVVFHEKRVGFQVAEGLLPILLISLACLLWERSISSVVKSGGRGLG